MNSVIAFIINITEHTRVSFTILSYFSLRKYSLYRHIIITISSTNDVDSQIYSYYLQIFSHSHSTHSSIISSSIHIHSIHSSYSSILISLLSQIDILNRCYYHQFIFILIFISFTSISFYQFNRYQFTISNTLLQTNNQFTNSLSYFYFSLFLFQIISISFI